MDTQEKKHEVGTVVGYEDMANPFRRGVVTEVRETRWGVDFEVTWEDGKKSYSDLRQCGWSFGDKAANRRTS